MVAYTLCTKIVRALALYFRLMWPFRNLLNAKGRIISLYAFSTLLLRLYSEYFLKFEYFVHNRNAFHHRYVKGVGAEKSKNIGFIRVRVGRRKKFYQNLSRGKSITSVCSDTARDGCQKLYSGVFGIE